MKMYMVTVESGALCEAYHVKADCQQLAEHGACRSFAEEFPHREITHYWAVAKDKA